MNESPKHWWSTLSFPARLAYAAAAGAWFFDCLDQQIFNLARKDAIDALIAADQNPKAWAGYATSTFLIGWGVGGLWLGSLGDKLGRARMLTLCIFLYAIFTGLSAFSFNTWDFTAYRFLTGVGVGGVFGLAVALISDVVVGPGRPKALGLFQSLSTVGNAGAGIASLVVSELVLQKVMGAAWGWKTQFLVGALPALALGFLMLKVPEPAAWVAARDSGKLVAGRAGSYTALLSDTKWRKNALLGLILCSAGILGLWGLGNFYPDIISKVLEDKFSADGLPKSDVAAAVMRNKAYALLVQNVGSFIGMVLFAKVAQKWGRKPAFALGFLCACASTMLLFRGLRTYADIWWMIPLFGASVYSLFAGYSIYLPELFPSALRSTGASLCYNGGRFVAATAPFTLGVLTTQLGEGKSPADKIEAFRTVGFWMSLILLTGLLVLPFLPETKDKPLPE